MFQHNPQDSDSYKRPVFSAKNKALRLLWHGTWWLLCHWTPAPFHRWRIWILRLFGARIGKTNFVYSSCKIWAPWLLETGDVVTIGPGVEIYNPAGAFLAHHVILSQHAYLCGATHNYNDPDFTYVKHTIILEAYCWICAKAMVLPGVHCGEGSVLGAGAVSAKDLAPWTIYVGNPAKMINHRTNFTKNDYQPALN